MKKTKCILLIMIFSFFFLPTNLLAEETLKVVFSTSFDQNIDIEKVDSIFIMMDDAVPKSYDIELTNEKDYRYEISGLINGNIQINDIFVNRDFSGKYSLSYEKKQVSSNEIEIKIKVSLSAPKNSTTVKVNDAILADVLGETYVDRVTEAIPNAGTAVGYDESKANSGNNNSSTGNTSEPSTNDSSTGDNTSTTTNSYGQTDKDLEEQSKKLEEERQQHEKEENIEKRNKIYTILLIVLILILLIAIVFVAIKFANANK